MPLRRKNTKNAEEPANAMLAADREGRAGEANGAASEQPPPAAERPADVEPATTMEAAGREPAGPVEPSPNGETAPMTAGQTPGATEDDLASPGPGPVPITKGAEQGPNGDHRPRDDRGLGGLIGRVYGDPGSASREERERQAAAEFEAAVAPVLQMAMSAVPDASSPDEAVRTLVQKQEQLEVRPDPMGGAYVPGDSYQNDARVYYRLLRRDYQKNPRPSKGALNPFRTLPSAWRGP